MAGETQTVYHPTRVGVSQVIPADQAERWAAQGWSFTDPFGLWGGSQHEMTLQDWKESQHGD